MCPSFVTGAGWVVYEECVVSAVLSLRTKAVQLNTVLDFINARWDHANKDEIFSTAVHELMFFVAGDKDCGPASYFTPFAILEYLTYSGVDKNFVFPFVGVPWGKTTGFYSKNTHAEVISLVFFPNNDSSCDTLYRIVVELVRRYLFIICYFHDVPMSQCFGSRILNIIKYIVNTDS